MVQSRSKIVRRLTLAQRDRSLVMVRRKFQDDDETPGFVIAVLDDWVAIHELANGPHLDVVVLLRLDLVTKVEAMWGQDYLTRGVAGLGKPIAEFECAPDATAKDITRIEFGGRYIQALEQFSESIPAVSKRVKR